MFEKRDHRVYKGVKIDAVWPQSMDWWTKSGFAVAQAGPGHLRGASYYSKIGLRREVEVRLQESKDELHVDLSFRAHITNEGAVGGAVTAVLLLPVAAVGGAISWYEYENEANMLIANYWQFLSQVTGKQSEPIHVPTPTPPPGPQVATPPSGPPAVRKCSRCGANLEESWKVCPHCGLSVV